MKITVKRTIDEKGYINITINGKHVDYSSTLELTGASPEYCYNLTPDEEGLKQFSYGQYKTKLIMRSIEAGMPFDELCTNIAINIKKVRGWVESCKDLACVEEKTFTI